MAARSVFGEQSIYLLLSHMAAFSEMPESALILI